MAFTNLIMITEKVFLTSFPEKTNETMLSNILDQLYWRSRAVRVLQLSVHDHWDIVSPTEFFLWKNEMKKYFEFLTLILREQGLNFRPAPICYHKWDILSIPDLFIWENEKYYVNY